MSIPPVEEAGHVSSWPLGGKVSVRGTGFGGFVGYNSQWDSVVLGLEFSYLHGKFGGSQSDSMSRSFVDGLGYTDNVTYQASAHDGDFRHGDVSRPRRLCGRIVPALYVRRGSAGTGGYRQDRHYQSGTQNACAGFTPSLTATVGQYSHLIYGYSGGLGVDMMLMSCLFLRAEWEYVRFTSAIDTDVNTFRVGLGYKF